MLHPPIHPHFLMILSREPQEYTVKDLHVFMQGCSVDLFTMYMLTDVWLKTLC